MHAHTQAKKIFSTPLQSFNLPVYSPSRVRNGCTHHSKDCCDEQFRTETRSGT